MWRKLKSDKVMLVRFVCADFRVDSQSLMIRMFFSSRYREGHTFANLCRGLKGPAFRHPVGKTKSISLSTSQLFQLKIILMPM